MKAKGTRTIFFTILLLTLTVSCELNGSRDILNIIDQEVAWANAKPLTITVYAGDWGRSPQEGGRCFDNKHKAENPRCGYPFDVEFTVNSGYGFVGWLAFTNDVYAGLMEAGNPNNINSISYEDALALSLDNSKIFISQLDEEGQFLKSYTGAYTATITVKVKQDITLVPFCSNRPRLDQRTNPPLNPILAPFPFDQTVNIWFTMAIQTATAELGNTIRVTGHYASGTERGQPFNKNGENGDLTAYYTLVFPSPPDAAKPELNNRVNLTPINDTYHPASDLALLSISVTVGPGIESSNGVAMAQGETISYQTDTREAQKVYRPGTVQASRNGAPDSFFQDGQWNSPDIDRRFNSHKADKKTVYVKFSVTPPEGAPPAPNRITVAERLAYNLRGSAAGGEIDTTYNYPGTGVSVSGGVYTITHEIKTLSPGIIQLVVLPCYDDPVSPYPPLGVNSAVSEGQYVTIVMDDAEPELRDMRTSLNDPSSKSEAGAYIYGSGEEMVLTIGNLGDLVDNGIMLGGIPASQAWSLPWTMDDTRNLFWYAQIGNGTISYGPTKVNSVTNPDNTWSVSSLSDLTEDTPYAVSVKFEDGIGNATDWKDTGLTVMYSTEEVGSVSNLKAVCNAAGNQITITWTQPPTYRYPELVIRTYRASEYGDVLESEMRTDFGREQKDTFSLYVPKIDSTGVMEGDAVSGVFGYEISVIAHNVAGRPITGPVWVYNIPGMTTTGTGTGTLSNTVRISDMGELPVSGAGTSGKNYVLTRDVNISGEWTPRGTSANAFQGKFYGNGHTITFSGNFGTAATAGIFGYTGGDTSEIRDLTVFYPNPVTANSATVAGGMVGYAAGQTSIQNCIADSAPSAALKITSTSPSDVYLGGMAGRLDSKGKINNCKAYLNVELAHSGGGISYSGGLSGCIGSDTSWGQIDDINCAGNVTCSKGSASGTIYAGGITGYMYRFDLSHGYYSGTLSVKRNSPSRGGSLYCGGIAGYSNRAITDCEFTGGGKIEVPDDNSETVYIGGIVGHLNGSRSSNCVRRGDIDVQSGGELRVGGIAGLINGWAIISNCVSGNRGNGDALFRVRLKSGADGPVYAGGFVGYSDIDSFGGYGIYNCLSEPGTLEITAYTGSVNCGGFAGCIKNSIVSGCSTETAVWGGSGSSEVCGGGFAGLLMSTGPGNRKVSLFNCLAQFSGGFWGDGDVYAGGLVGRSQGREDALNVIWQCQAMDGGGDFIISGSAVLGKNFYSGGLVGYSEYTQVSESKSMLYLETSYRNATTYAGGLVGYAEGGSIRNCYALNSVKPGPDSPLTNEAAVGGIAGKTVKCDVRYNVKCGWEVAIEHPGTGAVYAGGIVGIFDGGTLSNNVVLCTGVSVTGNGTLSAGRIYGNLILGSDPDVPTVVDQNFALYSMYIRVNSSDVDISDVPDQHGQNTVISELRKTDFWLDTDNGPGFNFDGKGTDFGNVVYIWDFSTVSGRGYPKLAWE